MLFGSGKASSLAVLNKRGFHATCGMSCSASVKWLIHLWLYYLASEYSSISAQI